MNRLWKAYCAWVTPWRAFIICTPFIIGIIIMATQIIRELMQ